MALMMRRDIISTGEGIKTTFSSWDSCMSKAYCKWPVIVGIVIASLIVLSIIWCLARCLCCGASCCCSCLRCLDCFTPNRHKRQSRYQDDYRPMNNQGFQPMPSPMVYASGGAGPQFATFDAPGRKVNEDSLPSMPTWSNAQERRIEDTTEQPEDQVPAQGHGTDVELGRVNSHPQNPNQPQQRRTSRGGYSQVPNGPGSPPLHSPYGAPNNATNYDYMAAGAVASQPISDFAPASTTGVPNRSQYSSSPAPTYATHDPQQNTLLAAGDAFTADAMAPTPHEYTSGVPISPGQGRTYNPTSPPPPSYASRTGAQQQPYLQQRRNPYSPQSTNNFSRPQLYSPITNGTTNGTGNAPYAPSLNTTSDSTQYEPSYSQGYGYSASPTQYHQSPSQYQSSSRYQQQSAGGAGMRPPSLLQAGRKPVGGSYREV